MKVALAMHQAGLLHQAEVHYKEILRSQARHFDALQLLATIALQRNQFAAAVRLFEEAFNINPEHADAHYNCGIALRALEQPAQALQSYDRALQLQPGHAQAYNNRGIALSDLQRLPEALHSYRQALQIWPGFAEAHNNCGIILSDLNRPQEALASYDEALRIKPDYADAHNNRGKALLDLKRLEQALDSYAQAQTIKPDHADAHFNEGLCRLLIGDFALGWQKHEWRLKTEKGLKAARVFTPTRWCGRENLNGKTILLHSEQGFGDTIQFCRYASQVTALGATVLLEVPLPLQTVLRDLDGVAMLLCQGEHLPQFDYHCPLMSLPLAFQTHMSRQMCTQLSTQIRTQKSTPTGIFSAASYLHSAPEKRAIWHARLNQNQQKRVGLVWSGNQLNKNNAKRSIALAQLNCLLNNTDHAHIDFYCLQQQLLAADQNVLEQSPAIRFFGSDLIDFSDTAALIDAMDLVITVDTSVAHLAGAMGKPVWILLPFNPDWRWQLERSDSPWYQSARLFRQPASGDWASVLKQIAGELSALIPGLMPTPMPTS